MTLPRLHALTPLFVDEMPREKEHGVLYVCERYGTAIHLCACGCGQESVADLLPFWPDGWTLTRNGELVTLSPSIGNFNGESPYHAHYHIRENRVEWC